MPLIKVKLFSHLKYVFEQDEIEIELGPAATTRDLEKKIRLMGGEQIATLPFRIALNQAFISEPQRITENDEIAIIPPVQGG